MSRNGLSPLGTGQALRLFDNGLHGGRPHLVPALLDLAALRRQADAGLLPALRGLVRAPAARRRGRRRRRPVLRAAPRRHARGRTRPAGGGPGQGAGHRGARLPPATVVPSGQTFTGLGFDSLTAVELRNRLTALTGIRLPASLIFDCPTPAALADFLLVDAARRSPNRACSPNWTGWRPRSPRPRRRSWSGWPPTTRRVPPWRSASGRWSPGGATPPTGRRRRPGPRRRLGRRAVRLHRPEVRPILTTSPPRP
ncbi:beta-ketoacyl reductase [Micromonospora sp. BRA006-A]|nr:beta-ketoacyl reductase [Micromonospora sp. BRA006-A]